MMHGPINIRWVYTTCVAEKPITCREDHVRSVQTLFSQHFPTESENLKGRHLLRNTGTDGSKILKRSLGNTVKETVSRQFLQLTLANTATKLHVP